MKKQGGKTLLRANPSPEYPKPICTHQRIELQGIKMDIKPEAVTIIH